MKPTPIVNDNGEYTNCAFHSKTLGRGKCTILNTWYNGKDAQQERCIGCPFFKTREQLDYEKQRSG